MTRAQDGPEVARDPINAVDPDLRAVVPLLPDFGTLDATTVCDFRDLLRSEAVPTGVVGAIAVENIVVPGHPGSPDVPALLYRPTLGDGARPAILDIHGGGYVCGSAERDHQALLDLAATLDCVILSVNYRLAPEHPFPAPADDCLRGLEWLHGSAERLGIDRARIAVRGASAGGGLAAGVCLRARQRPDLPIAFAALIYPMLDDRTEGTPFAGHYVWPVKANRFGWASYLGDTAANPPIDAAPGRATDLAGFPPCFMAVGDIDLFAIEDLAFAQGLMAAGVPVELHVYPGAYHGFVLVTAAGVAQKFERDCRDALARALTQPAHPPAQEGNTV